MSAFILVFKDQLRLDDGQPLPTEHVFLYGSENMTSFIDVSKHWQLPGTVLSVIAADFGPLREGETEAQMYQWLRRDLKRYLSFEDAQLVDWRVRPNLGAHETLFLNRAGSWSHRPGTKTRIENLYIAGDYCRTDVDLTTMESAVMSGLRTAEHILRDLQLPSDVGYEELPRFRRRFWRVAQAMAYPAALFAHLWRRAFGAVH